MPLMHANTLGNGGGGGDDDDDYDDDEDDDDDDDRAFNYPPNSQITSHTELGRKD